MARKRSKSKEPTEPLEDPFMQCLQILRALPPASDDLVKDWCWSVVGWELPDASDETIQTEYFRFLERKLVALRNILEALPKAKGKCALEIVACLLAFRSHDTIRHTLRALVRRERRPSETTIRRNAELIRKREGDRKRWSIQVLRRQYFPDGVDRNVTKVMAKKKKWLRLERQLRTN
jgi:hypothetical protein